MHRIPSSSVASWLCVLTVALGLSFGAGCVAEPEPTAATQTEDLTSFPVIDAELGTSWSFTVAAKPKAARATGQHAKVLRVVLAPGESVAAVARATGGDPMDAYLALFDDTTGEELARSEYDQALLPMAAEADAVLVHTATEQERLLVFVADREMQANASVQVDLVRMDATVGLDLNLTNPAVRKYVELLRADEPTLTDYLARGAVTEGADGLLVTNPAALPLNERATLNGFVAHQNDWRSSLFAEHVRSNLGEADPSRASEVGVVLGELWRDLRVDPHALRP